MLIYINPSGEYPRYPGDIQSENLDWTIDDPLPEGWIQVVDVEMPIATNDQFVYESYPELVDGVYLRNWITRELTDQEKADRDSPATERDELLRLGLSNSEVVEILRKAI